MGSTTVSKIVIVGAGVNGLACAIGLALSKPHYEIRVVERRPYDAASSTAVSGLHLKPNGVRILHKWGVDGFFARGTVISATQMHRWSDNSIVASFSRPKAATQNGEPESPSAQTWYINRADFWTALYERAQSLGIEVLFDQKVTAIDVEAPSLTLEGDQTVHCDVLIGADGLRSAVRTALFPDAKFDFQLSSDVVYQISLPEEAIFSLPASQAASDLQAMYKTKDIFRTYFAPGQSMVSATCEHRRTFEAQLLVMGHEPASHPGPMTGVQDDMAPVHALLQGWDPAIQLAFRLAPTAWKWRVGVVPDLPAYSSAGGRVCLVGDSAHAALPWGGFGAGLGLEDAATLVELLAHGDGTVDLPRTAKTYYHLRHPRVERVRAQAVQNGLALQMPDGPEQQRRDRNVKLPPPKLAEVDPEWENPFGKPEFHGWLNGFDAIAEARKAGEEKGKTL